MKEIAWSHSALTKFETCPRQFYLTRITKQVKEPPTEHADWGNAVHKALELRVRDKTPLPEGMQQWEYLAAEFDRYEGVQTEQQIALTRNLETTGWFDKDVWCRSILDISVVGRRKAFAGDWKTGKVKPDNDQLKLFAAVLMQLNPELDQVNTAFIWLAHDKVSTNVFTRQQLPEIWEEYTQRAGRIQLAAEKDRWIPKPSGLCKGWCPVGKDFCEFWQPKPLTRK